MFFFLNEVSGVFWEPQQAHEQAREDAVAQLVNMQSNSGWSALMTAAWAGDSAAVQLLLRSGRQENNTNHIIPTRARCRSVDCMSSDSSVADRLDQDTNAMQTVRLYGSLRTMRCYLSK